jgi:hypothetical protein
MPPEIQRLQDAAEQWRTQHKAVDERLARSVSDLDAAELERRALSVAIKAVDICIARRVVPRFVCPAEFVTEVVIPPKPSAIEHAELSRHSHGPVVVECELGCLTAHAALDLVDEAHRASEYARGWAPLYVRLWVELLRHESERTLARPKHAGPRLVVASDRDDGIDDGQ